MVGGQLVHDPTEVKAFARPVHHRPVHHIPLLQPEGTEECDQEEDQEGDQEAQEDLAAPDFAGDVRGLAQWDTFQHGPGDRGE